MGKKKSSRVISKNIQHDRAETEDEDLEQAKPVKMPLVTEEEHEARTENNDEQEDENQSG